MIYDITATISYTYNPPAAAGRNLLRLMPADLPGRQRLILGQVAASPAPMERSDRIDFFGNRVTEMVFRQPAATAAFTLRARVERMADVAPLDFSPPLQALAEEIASVQSVAPEAPHHFLGPSPRVALEPEITAFAREAMAGAATTAAAVQAFGEALHAEMTFDSTATTVHTPPAEAFALRHGVCQDFAQIMIAGLRGMGVPAGYVSGFLRTLPPKGQPRLEGADAMHAWVRAWCGTKGGWIDYDPTNAMHAGEGHVTVAHGRDYGDALPLQGVLRTSGGQTSGQSVDTRPVGPRAG
jgi:transglutaminase-like putative cysteine protease